MQDSVEIDGAFFRGSDPNRHARKKGAKPKTAVAGVKDRHTNKISAKPAPETTKTRLEHYQKQ